MTLYKKIKPCRNPYFIGINSAIKAKKDFLLCSEQVAILILLELTLQCDIMNYKENEEFCRNPYFIGINSAIKESVPFALQGAMSQSLFYWN